MRAILKATMPCSRTGFPIHEGDVLTTPMAAWGMPAGSSNPLSVPHCVQLQTGDLKPCWYMVTAVTTCSFLHSRLCAWIGRVLQVYSYELLPCTTIP